MRSFRDWDVIVGGDIIEDAITWIQSWPMQDIWCIMLKGEWDSDIFCGYTKPVMLYRYRARWVTSLGETCPDVTWACFRSCIKAGEVYYRQGGRLLVNCAFDQERNAGWRRGMITFWLPTDTEVIFLLRTNISVHREKKHEHNSVYIKTTTTNETKQPQWEENKRIRAFPPQCVNCISMDISGLHSLFYDIQIA